MRSWNINNLIEKISCPDELPAKDSSPVFNETKYMALSDCGCQLVWTRNLPNEVINVLTPHFYGDNLGLLF